MTPRFDTVALDAEGLSSWIAQERKVVAMFREFHEQGTDLVVCANTIIEVGHRRLSVPRLNWALSRIKVEPVTVDSAKRAVELLKVHDLHGHKHALDASVAEVALRQPGPVAMITSDPEDMARLCGRQVRLISV